MGYSNALVLICMFTTDAHLKSFHRKAILTARLETILMVLCQKMWLFCPKNLSEAKLKSFGLMSLIEVSRQPTIDCVDKLLLATLMGSKMEKEQTEQIYIYCTV